MSEFDIAQSYGAAEKIVESAQNTNVDIHPVWNKLFRVKQYLRKQAAEELSEVLA